MEGPGRLVRILDNLRPSDSDRGVLDNVRVHLKHNVTCAHGGEFITAKGPVGRPVGNLHLGFPTGVNVGSDFPRQVLSNHDDLRSRVDYSSFGDPVSDPDIDLTQGQRVGRLAHASGKGTLGGRVCDCDFLQAAGFNASDPQFLDEVLPDGWTGRQDVCRGGVG
jgi:hypothetical protein